MKAMFDPVSFGAAVKAYRDQLEGDKRKTLSTRAASKLIGISYATLSRVERGNPPSVEVFAKICHWMRADASAWLGLYQDIDNG